jgi:Ca-activated chloride channel homolog
MLRGLYSWSVIYGGCLLMELFLLGVIAAQEADPFSQNQSPAQEVQAQQSPPNAAPIQQNAGNSTRSAVEIKPPESFKTKDGRHKGWKVTIPGDHALATPAVVDGKLFIGGGFGSHEFYAFDAQNGKLLWQYHTSDDGPTAAVVAEGYVVFNTESCELEILTPDGKPVWKKWLGDPLMSMPAIAEGKIYMAYPNSRGDRKHYLACFELKTGKSLWNKPIAGEIITAPLIEDGQVYLATLEGTVYCFNAADGKLAWSEKKNATSAPVIWEKQCYFSRREESKTTKAGKTVSQQNEQIASRETTAAGKVRDMKETARKADYLDYAKRGRSSKEAANQEADSSVGFGGSKGDAKMEQARGNLGQASVQGVWSYQGSKPFIYKGRIFSSMGDTLICIDPKAEKILWNKHFPPKKVESPGELLDSHLTPPATTNGRVFLCTGDGQVICVSSGDGEPLWTADIGEPIAFQPSIAKGRIYISTTTGNLYCLETGDEKDDDWLMWGANAAHSGKSR